MAKLKPIVTAPSSGYNKPVPTRFQDQSEWAFSFKYFNQIKYFGLDRSESKWFVSLIDRIKDLSSENREEIITDRKKSGFYRYHKINWESKSIPIKRSELNWIDKNYLENEEEFPFYQFTISKAHGRVIGFWNENHTFFNIVLLDPLHNLQPSKDFNYKVDDCYPLSCEYSSIIKDLEEINTETPICDNCNIQSELVKIPKKLNQTNAIIGFLDDDFLSEYEKLTEKLSLSEILEIGILNANN